MRYIRELYSCMVYFNYFLTKVYVYYMNMLLFSCKSILIFTIISKNVEEFCEVLYNLGITLEKYNHFCRYKGEILDI